MVSRLLAIALVAGLIGLVGVAIFRPATLFGVDASALANSLGGEMDHAQAKCVGEGSDHWRCALRGGNFNGAEYVVTTHRYGCWSGSPVAARRTADPAEPSISGCIGLADEFGS
jgi:hypothetical protein